MNAILEFSKQPFQWHWHGQTKRVWVWALAYPAAVPWSIFHLKQTWFEVKIVGNSSFLLLIFVALSTFGAVNGNILTTSRLFYAGAREGQMPEVLSMIQINRVTPLPSVLVITILSLLYLSSSNIIQLINYCSFSIWLSIGAAVFCVPYLRWKCPDLHRPIK